MWSGQWPGPEPAGSGLAWASNMTIALRAGPGLGILFAGRAGPGPHNSVCGPGRVCTTAAGPGRAWASNHICGPGLGINYRPVQGPTPNRNLRIIVVSGASRCGESWGICDVVIPADTNMRRRDVVLNVSISFWWDLLIVHEAEL